MYEAENSLVGVMSDICCRYYELFTQLHLHFPYLEKFSNVIIDDTSVSQVKLFFRNVAIAKNNITNLK